MWYINLIAWLAEQWWYWVAVGLAAFVPFVALLRIK